MFKELVFKSFVPNIVASSFKQCLVFCIVFGYSFHLLVVISARQGGQAIGIQFPAARVQLSTVILGELSTKGVNGDDDSTAISLELKSSYRGTLI